jgi:ferredoxin
MGFDSRYGYRAGGRSARMDGTIPVTVREDGEETVIEAERGAILRDVLRSNGVDVYGSVSRVTNCGGRGLCGTCGVRIEGADGTAVPAAGLHDAAAKRWGYLRLSCRIRVTEPMTVELVEKVLWGQLLPD